MIKETDVQTNLVHLTIDAKAVAVPRGTTVYTAAKQVGIDIPIFCYQERMPPFGACRMCLVEVEKMSKLQTACTLEATEGMVVKTQSAEAVEGRKGIIEFLLINHPLDCPICDRGGECPLQENALKCGPGKSRFFEEKRHFKKALPLGPVLMLDRERCIVCARCTRFGELIAGDHALEFIDRGFKTEVGTPNGGPAESKYIGNTIMICPVGALTSQVYRFRARPWDNDSVESTCTLCPVGCSLILDSRDGEIMRTRSRENRDVNDIWLCDKGWFGYEFVENPDRLTQPMLRVNGELQKASWEEALSLAASKIQEVQQKKKIAAWGGNPLTTEENYLFQQLMREVIGVNHLDHRIGMTISTLDAEGVAPGMEMSLGECEELSFAVLLGIDLTEEFPVLWLRLRQAINRGATTIFIGHYAPEISRYLTNVTVHSPDQDFETVKRQMPDIEALAKNGKKGAIFVGRQYLSGPHRKEILSELIKVRKTNRNVSLNLLEGKGNSFGARLAGMRPDLAPLGVLLVSPGLNALQVLEKASTEGWDLLYVAGANPAKKFQSKRWAEARAKLGCLIVQDLFLTETAKQADIVFPALSFVEKQGSFVNIEGRVQKLLPGKEIPKNLFNDGEIFHQLAQKLQGQLDIDKNFFDTLAQERIPLTHWETIDVSINSKLAEKQSATKPKEGALFATFAPALFDQGVRMKHNPHTKELAKEPYARVHPSEGAKRGLQKDSYASLKVNGNSVSVKIKYDERVATGVIVLPMGFDACAVQDLDVNWMNGFLVECE